MNFRKLISIGVLLFLLSSFFILLFYIDSDSSVNWSEAWWAFKNSALQSFFSSLLTLLFGFVVALGLIKIRQQNPWLFSLSVVFCLIPQFVPVVISLIGVMGTLNPFPMGIAGIVLVHVFLNFGLAAVLIHSQLQNIWGGTSDVARTLGANRFQYLRKVGFPLLKKDYLLMFIFFFSIFFSSFSVPLIVGGGRGTTLEVLIYEKMRLSSDWSGASYLAMLQAVFVLLLSAVTWRSQFESRIRETNLKWLGSYLGLILLYLTMFWFFMGYSSGLMEGLHQLDNLKPFVSDLIEGALSSLILAALTFILILHAFKLLAYLQHLPTFLDRFLKGYIAPSTALTCFGILILFPSGGIMTFFKIPLAFLMLALPSMYRLGWGEKLKRIRGQVMVARTFGASAGLIFRSVVWPQMKSDSRFLGALVATWACGDFAVSRILAQQDFTLGLILESLLSSYRISLASVISVLLVALCLIVFLTIMGWDYVDRRSSES